MSTFEVVIIGAGPAGAVAALELAKVGVRVGVLERARWPRAKVCGDALWPDALRVLDHLGLRAGVEASGHAVTGVTLVTPGGRRVEVDEPLWTLRRQRLDALVMEEAVARGATLLDEVLVDAPLLDPGGVVCGVRCASGRARFEVQARVTLLACGAASKVLRKFGVSERTTPSALAMRGLYHAPALDPGRLLVSFEAGPGGGWAWAFPLGGGVANVGCGRFLVDGRLDGDLRELMGAALTEAPVLGAALAGAEVLEAPVGAPLRCDLDGAAPMRPGLLVVGEALGLTYGLGGQGVGKAMESGRMAAMACLGALNTGEAASLGAYLKLMERELVPQKLAVAEAARRWTAEGGRALESWAWRAARSERMRARLAAALREEGNPEALLGPGGGLRAWWG